MNQDKCVLCMSVCVCVCMYVCMYVCAGVGVCVCVCVCVCDGYGAFLCIAAYVHMRVSLGKGMRRGSGSVVGCRG